MIGESILELHKTNATNESIKSYEYDKYQPVTGTQLNSAGQIAITIENQDQFLHLHNSYLLIEGNVLKAANTSYTDADLIALTNNGLLYLFSSLKLTLAGQTVEHFSVSRDDKYAVLRTAAAGAGKVVWSKLVWSVPIVQPNDRSKVNLYRSIASNNVIPISFRMGQSETFSLPQGGH